jgi:hypothetical protein
MDNRYIIVKYLRRPNGQWDEYTEFRRNIRSTHIESAKVILDLKERKCVVNTINRQADFYDMLDMYKRLLGDKLISQLPEDLKVTIDR